VACLGRLQREKAQGHAAGALGNMCWSEGLREMVTSVPGVVSGLAGLLAAKEGGKGYALSQAARALRQMAEGPDELKERVMGAPGALPALLALLAPGSRADASAKEAAAGVFAALTDTDDEEVRGSVACTADLLPALGALLGPDGPAAVPVQQQAARALRNICRGEAIWGERVASAPGVLAALVAALAAGRDELVQERAAGALGLMAWSSDALREQLGLTSGALPALARLLVHGGSPGAKHRAMGALQALAAGGEAQQQEVARAVCGELLPLLEPHSSAVAQEQALQLLADLTEEASALQLGVQEHISQSPEIMDTLASAMQRLSLSREGRDLAQQQLTSCK
jgi:hypothetical protein